MIKGELLALFTRRWLWLLVLLALMLCYLRLSQDIDQPNARGYIKSELNAAYAALPDDKELAMAQLADRLESFDFSTYTDWMLYSDLYERLSAVVRYPENLRSRMEEAEIMMLSPFFALPGTFDYRSLGTALSAYRRISEKDINPVAESSVGVEFATETRVIDMTLAFIALSLAIGIMMLQKEEGLYPLLGPMYRGRGKLFITKYCVLAGLLFLATLLAYGMSLAMSAARLGLGDLDRPIQSIHGFSTSRFSLSVGQYIALFALHKFLWAACLGSLFTCICVFVRNSMQACIAALALLGVSVLAWQSAEPWIRMTGLIWVSDTCRYFSGYYNLDFLGYPVDAFAVGVAVKLVLIAASALAAYARFTRAESVRGIRAKAKARPAPRFFSRHTSLLLHEGYKLYVRQYGLLILALFLSFQCYMAMSRRYYVDAYDRRCAEALAGPPSLESETFILAENERFDDINSRLAQYSRQLQNGTISAETFRIIAEPLNTALLAEPAFRRAETQYAQISALAAEHPGVAYVELQVYDYILGARARQYNGISAMALGVAIGLGLSDLFAVERSSGMDMLLSCSPRKRRSAAYKISFAALFALLSALIAYVPGILGVSRALGLHHLGASVRSLTFLRDIPGDTTILQHAVGIGALWAACACAGAAFAMLVSRHVKTRAVSALISCLALAATFRGLLP